MRTWAFRIAALIPAILIVPSLAIQAIVAGLHVSLCAHLVAIRPKRLAPDGRWW